MVSHKKQYHTGTRKLNTDKKQKRPSEPESDTETMSVTSSDRSMHDILNNNNFMGNQMNPMMGNQMNPMMGNQMNPMMGNQMNPMMGNQMNPMMGNQMNPMMGNQMNPMMGNQMDPMMGHQMNPMMGNQMDPMFDPLSIQTFAPVNNNTNFNNLALLSNNTRHAEMNLPAMSHPGINHMEMNYAGMNQQVANQPVMNQPGMNNARPPQEVTEPMKQPAEPMPVNAQSGNTYSLKNLSNLIK
jgi:hypothetical protein